MEAYKFYCSRCKVDHAGECGPGPMGVQGSFPGPAGPPAMPPPNPYYIAIDCAKLKESFWIQGDFGQFREATSDEIFQIENKLKYVYNTK